MADGQMRLSYLLSTVPRTQRFILLPQSAEGLPLYEIDLKPIRSLLNALDKPIVQEICSAGEYGYLSDSQLARLLPLLAKRKTMFANERLVLLDAPLVPRISFEHSIHGDVQVKMQLFSDKEGMIQLHEGRLLVGVQVFFLRGHQANPVVVPTPWLLAAWAKDPVQKLSEEQLSTTAGRDAWVKDMLRLGIPAEDLDTLAVRRGPPNNFTLRLLPFEEASEDGLQIKAILQANYPLGSVIIDGGRISSSQIKPVFEADNSMGPIERDVAAEEEAQHRLRYLGLSFDKQQHAFVAKEDIALRLLDANYQLLPKNWHIDRSAVPITFRHDLTLATYVHMQEDSSLLDLRIQVQSEQTEQTDSQAAIELIGMKELLHWLQSGKRYVRLNDGSYAIPSAKFRRGLRILDDLGASSDRVLISPLCIGMLRAIGNEAGLAAADSSAKAWLEELSSSKGPAVVEPPTQLNAVLRDYQRRGLDWLMMLHRYKLTGVLADEMGLGKTLQTLALLLLVREQEGSKPSLVVAPTSVVTVWRDEAMRFAPSLRIVMWYGPPELRRNLNLQDVDLVVTSYGILRRDTEWFANVDFRYVILDEAQSAKNSASQNAHAVRCLKSDRRLALSGTPLENRPEELWTAFDFLAPGFLGSLRQFRKRYAMPILRGDKDALDMLRLRMQPLMLRRLKSEVAVELPAKVESIVRCTMSTAQRALYDHVAGQLRENIRLKIAKLGIERSQMAILAALTRLRQICCDPALLNAPAGARVPPSAKLALFEELMRETLAANRCVVVFSQFVQMQKRLIDVIKKLGVEPLWLHGGSRHRDKIVASFQDPAGPPVIVVSLRAGGTGLTLTRANEVMFYDPWWNPAVERQATDRAHRIGQSETVFVRKLICERSIEESVLQIAGSKTELFDNLILSEGSADPKWTNIEQVMAFLT